MWYLLENKIPTWDHMKKRMIEGPGWCALCKNDEQSEIHLFLSFFLSLLPNKSGNIASPS
jgi:hypothetical protein